MKGIFLYIQKNYCNFDGNEIITSVDFARQCEGIGPQRNAPCDK